ncbi:MAG: hypothetical protein A2W90_18070 [Bacteroidetes bacterium GWF2_42_66]|nr:MAG: hypothetical protein A2W92_06060 [Bacteroidetes bacterium GWA2_42_15]OFX98159.1 MAG: hypothetical protein A2W89_09560 [Bacteroidetes bacterium GWE2_42_39]OFY42544.1 MAG: hypothetical protein A2W90_18070 [Bacteroidetes bacterium GWF2_42_66]HBL74260.1 hypothetical protein [Prolixibacteraceae bacterium]HCU64029.1 hypothetical protein [Prolixibacteraceae bacterium]
MYYDGIQKIIIGGTSTYSSTGGYARLSVIGTGGQYGGLSLAQFDANANGCTNYIVKSRGAYIGSHVAVLAGDKVWSNIAEASDGSNFVRGARYDIEIDINSISGIVPMRHVWQTMNSSGTIAERMRLTSRGALLLNTSIDNEIDALQIVGSVSATSTLKATSGMFSNLTAGYIPSNTASGLANSIILQSNGTNINTEAPEYNIRVFTSGFQPSGTTCPVGNYIAGLTFRHGLAAVYESQLAFSTNENLYLRAIVNGVLGGWKQVWHSGNSNLSTVNWSANNITASSAINASSYQFAGTELKLDAHKSGSLGAYGTVYVSGGASSTPIWVAKSSIDIINFGSGSATLGQIPVANGSGGLLFATPSLEDLSDVEWSGTKLNNQLLRFNSTSGKWYNWTHNFQIDSLKFEGNYLKIYENSQAEPDSVYIESGVQDNAVTYNKLANEFKRKSTVTSSVDLSADAIGTISLSANTTFTFSNLQVNKTYTLILDTNGYTPTFPAYCTKTTGSLDVLGDYIYYIDFRCFNASSGSEEILYTVFHRKNP